MCNISVAQNSLQTIHSCQCEQFQWSGSMFSLKHAEHTGSWTFSKHWVEVSQTMYFTFIWDAVQFYFCRFETARGAQLGHRIEGLSSESMCVSARGTGNSSRWWAAHLSVTVPNLMLTDSWETRGSVVTHLHACRHEHGGVWISCEQMKGGSIKHNTVLHC